MSCGCNSVQAGGKRRRGKKGGFLGFGESSESSMGSGSDWMQNLNPTKWYEKAKGSLSSYSSSPSSVQAPSYAPSTGYMASGGRRTRRRRSSKGGRKHSKSRKSRRSRKH